MAVIDLTRAIALSPADPALYNNRGNVYRALGEPALAIEDFGRAIALSPGDQRRYTLTGAPHMMDAGR